MSTKKKRRRYLGRIRRVRMSDENYAIWLQAQHDLIRRENLTKMEYDGFASLGPIRQENIVNWMDKMDYDWYRSKRKRILWIYAKFVILKYRRSILETAQHKLLHFSYERYSYDRYKDLHLFNILCYRKYDPLYKGISQGLISFHLLKSKQKYKSYQSVLIPCNGNPSNLLLTQSDVSIMGYVVEEWVIGQRMRKHIFYHSKCVEYIRTGHIINDSIVYDYYRIVYDVFHPRNLYDELTEHFFLMYRQHLDYCEEDESFLLRQFVCHTGRINFLEDELFIYYSSDYINIQFYCEAIYFFRRVFSLYLILLLGICFDYNSYFLEFISLSDDVHWKIRAFSDIRSFVWHKDINYYSYGSTTLLYINVELALLTMYRRFFFVYRYSMWHRFFDVYYANRAVSSDLLIDLDRTISSFTSELITTSVCRKTMDLHFLRIEEENISSHLSFHLRTGGRSRLDGRVINGFPEEEDVFGDHFSWRHEDVFYSNGEIKYVEVDNNIDFINDRFKSDRYRIVDNKYWVDRNDWYFIEDRTDTSPRLYIKNINIENSFTSNYVLDRGFFRYSLFFILYVIIFFFFFLIEFFNYSYFKIYSICYAFFNMDIDFYFFFNLYKYLLLTDPCLLYILFFSIFIFIIIVYFILFKFDIFLYFRFLKIHFFKKCTLYLLKYSNFAIHLERHSMLPFRWNGEWGYIFVLITSLLSSIFNLLHSPFSFFFFFNLFFFIILSYLIFIELDDPFSISLGRWKRGSVLFRVFFVSLLYYVGYLFLFLSICYYSTLFIFVIPLIMLYMYIFSVLYYHTTIFFRYIYIIGSIFIILLHSGISYWWLIFIFIYLYSLTLGVKQYRRIISFFAFWFFFYALTLFSFTFATGLWLWRTWGWWKTMEPFWLWKRQYHTSYSNAYEKLIVRKLYPKIFRMAQLFSILSNSLIFQWFKHNNIFLFSIFLLYKSIHIFPKMLYNVSLIDLIYSPHLFLIQPLFYIILGCIYFIFTEFTSEYYDYIHRSVFIRSLYADSFVFFRIFVISSINIISIIYLFLDFYQFWYYLIFFIYTLYIFIYSLPRNYFLFYIFILSISFFSFFYTEYSHIFLLNGFHMLFLSFFSFNIRLIDIEYSLYSYYIAFRSFLISIESFIYKWSDKIDMLTRGNWDKFDRITDYLYMDDLDEEIVFEIYMVICPWGLLDEFIYYFRHCFYNVLFTFYIFDFYKDINDLEEEIDLEYNPLTEYHSQFIFAITYIYEDIYLPFRFQCYVWSLFENSWYIESFMNLATNIVLDVLENDRIQYNRDRRYRLFENDSKIVLGMNHIFTSLNRLKLSLHRLLRISKIESFFAHFNPRLFPRMILDYLERHSSITGCILFLLKLRILVFLFYLLIDIFC